MRAGAGGEAAGRLGERLGLPSATLSFHLNQLKQAGLVTFRREGRSRVYAANYPVMNGLLAYLAENCCRDDASACGTGACDPPTTPDADEGTTYEALARTRVG